MSDKQSGTPTTSPISSHVHQLAATKLAAVGQRYTTNRKAVVDVLCGLPGPATIAELLSSGGQLAQSSTYRNLVVLEEVGVVHRIVTSDDHARFELTEEITGHHHHHLICEQCGRIIDVTLSGDVESSLQGALAAAAEAHSFTGLRHRVDLMGLCASCSEAQPTDGRGAAAAANGGSLPR
ncbi:MAG: transcriptional repressor [Actinomycetota bacterium]